MAAHDAVFLTPNPAPARCPQPRPSSRPAYTYVPPDCGNTAASRAVDVALHHATAPASSTARGSHTPAARAAGAGAEKMPAPSIAPRPTTTASFVPSRRASRAPLGSLAPGPPPGGVLAPGPPSRA